MSTISRNLRCVIIPGNGCTPILQSNWYGALAGRLERSRLFTKGIGLEDMPDPYTARETIWLPFMKNTLGVDEDTIIIGHSSGAEAAMRFAETNKVEGLVLVAACHTDLGDANERASGYYSRPWQWDQIKANTNWILQYHSIDDPLIPIEEADYVASQLQSTYTRFEDRSHFFEAKDVAHVLDDIIEKIRSQEK